MTHPPPGISLCLWTAAAVLSGLPNVLCDPAEKGLCPYFWLMLVGRIMSGVGEVRGRRSNHG